MKGRALLVFPSLIKEARADFPPLGIAYLASYVLNQRKNMSVKIIDFNIERFSPEKWRQQLLDFKPDVVGVSVLALNYPNGVNIAKLTREFTPSVLIIMGGPHATARPEECLNFCDIVVRGEGEQAFWEILQGKDLDTIKGISYRKEGRVIHNEGMEFIHDLDNLPFPAYHLLKLDKYKSYPACGIMSSRGCPYQCIFCSSHLTWGRFLRLRSPKNVVDEIEYLHHTFKIDEIVFFDDDFNIPQHGAIEKCEEIIRRGLHKEMSFRCMLRANRPLVSNKLFKRLKEANFTLVGFGIESGSEKVLRAIKKDLSLEDAKLAISLSRETGIKTVEGFFMVGNWDETLRDVLKTWRFVLSTKVLPAFTICTPFPGTEFYYRLKEKGYIGNNLNWSNFNFTTPITRTNRMSRLCIFTVYVLSIILQLALSFKRGGRPIHSLSRMIANALDKLKAVGPKSVEKSLAK